MFFVFITRRPTPPLFLGGAEITHNFLAEQLTANGHSVIFIGSIENPTYPAKERQNFYEQTIKCANNIKNLSFSDKCISYQYNGIACYLYSQNILLDETETLLKTIKNKITAIILSMEGADKLVSVAKKYTDLTIGWLHSINIEGTIVAKGNPNILISTSEYIQQKTLSLYNIPNFVFYSGFSNISKIINTGDKITFINPVKEKGADFVLELARNMPEEQFLAVEGWYKNDEFYDNMPTNIKYYPLQMEMDNIWKQTRILIVPSVVEEAFGRVIVEASLRGIPVIAHNIGGISEALNGAGILLDSLDVNLWIKAISICKNENNYKHFQNLAYNCSQKLTRNVCEEFLNLIQNVKKK